MILSIRCIEDAGYNEWHQDKCSNMKSKEVGFAPEKVSHCAYSSREHSGPGFKEPRLALAGIVSRRGHSTSAQPSLRNESCIGVTKTPFNLLLHCHCILAIGCLLQHLSLHKRKSQDASLNFPHEITFNVPVTIMILFLLSP
jgi:hypothetical protein